MKPGELKSSSEFRFESEYEIILSIIIGLFLSEAKKLRCIFLFFLNFITLNICMSKYYYINIIKY